MATATNIERTELLRQKREARRRQVRRRRLSALGVLGVLAITAIFGIGGLLFGGSGSVTLTPVASAAPVSQFRSAAPAEIRGIHVTGPLMTLTGKLDSYLAHEEGRPEHDRARPEGRERQRDLHEGRAGRCA